MSRNTLLEAGATIECGFTLKRVRDMTRAYSQEFSRLYTNLLDNKLSDKSPVSLDESPFALIYILKIKQI